MFRVIQHWPENKKKRWKMPLSRMIGLFGGIAFSTAILVSVPAAAFFDGQTGVADKQLKAACPAFASGEVKLIDSTSPPGNLPMVDVFEHESGARCSCTRSRTDKTLRCGPVAPGRSAARSG
jgi:hypothetical protein